MCPREASRTRWIQKRERIIFNDGRASINGRTLAKSILSKVSTAGKLMALRGTPVRLKGRKIVTMMNSLCFHTFWFFVCERFIARVKGFRAMNICI